MKGKFFALFTNFLLCAILIFTATVGYDGAKIMRVSAEYKKVYYQAEKNRDGVCLTFNVYERTDNVNKILDILKRYGQTATFFLGGAWADDNVDCVRKIYAEGHEIGSHGYFHKSHDKMSYKENLHEIEPSVRLLNAILLTEIKLFAPPSGAYNDATLLACDELNLDVIMWSRDTIDWRDKDVNLIFKRATKNLEGGEIILMHPTDATIIALDQILKFLSDNGLKTYTVSQCIGE